MIVYTVIVILWWFYLELHQQVVQDQPLRVKETTTESFGAQVQEGHFQIEAAGLAWVRH